LPRLFFQAMCLRIELHHMYQFLMRNK
jgi:hypothetical protein